MAARPSPGTGGFCDCLSLPINWLDPTRREALLLTYVSLLASAFFWILSFADAFSDRTSTMFGETLESFFDLLSTALVLWRLRKVNGLEESPTNMRSEQRTSAGLSLCMLGIATVLISFAAYSFWQNNTKAVNRHKLGLEVTLAFPSAVVYLIIGMCQWALGMVMRLRSLRQDGVISIMAALVSLGALLGALINLITCKYMEYIDLPHENGTITTTGRTGNDEVVGTPHPGTALYDEVRHHAARLVGTADDTKIFLHHQVTYPYYWCEDLITVLLATVILIFGLTGLVTDASEGVRWWSLSFWSDVIPEDESDDAPKKGMGSNEATPLVRA